MKRSSRPQKINSRYAEIKKVIHRSSKGFARLMSQDEAGFGRIHKPKYCWCPKGRRPITPCHHIREYRYAYGSVEPETGESFFLILPYGNTTCMNLYLQRLSQNYADDQILLVVDGASWHRSATLQIPENIEWILLPPYTPEMNPIEQIWKEIRKIGFRNELFASLSHVMDRLSDTICKLTAEKIRSITKRSWIIASS